MKLARAGGQKHYLKNSQQEVWGEEASLRDTPGVYTGLV